MRYLIILALLFMGCDIFRYFEPRGCCTYYGCYSPNDTELIEGCNEQIKVVCRFNTHEYNCNTDSAPNEVPWAYIEKAVFDEGDEECDCEN